MDKIHVVGAAPGLSPQCAGVGDVGDIVAFGLDSQLREHEVGRENIAVFHLRDEDGSRVACLSDIASLALCHDALGDMMEDHTAHAATRSRQSTFLYADDTAVFRVVGGEITGKRQQVVCHSALVAY